MTCAVTYLLLSRPLHTRPVLVPAQLAQQAAYTCSAAEIAGIQTRIAAEKSNKKLWSACPDLHWGSLVTLPSSPVLMNIGANKGYAVAEWLADFGHPEGGVTPHSLRGFYRTRFPDLPLIHGCGYCKDCHYGRDRKVTRAEVNPQDYPGIKVYAVEPSNGNFQLLEAFFNEFAEKLDLTLVKAAVSNSTGVAEFPNVKVGHEAGFIGDVSNGYTMVNVTTVDDLMEAYNLQGLDILKIDTEGFDPLVLKGAQRTLSQGRASIVNFEYHSLNHWQTTSLKSVVEQLDQYGYDCYFEASLAMIRITRCWNDAMEFKKFSNVLCALRSGPHNSIFMNLAGLSS